MNPVWISCLTALALGAGHALEVDHMVAVTAFVGGSPRLGAALVFGLRWGVGHSLAVLVAGTLLALSGLHVPPGTQDWAELGVGCMLVALGGWAVHAARRLHVHLPQDHGGHAHLHAHAPGAFPHAHAHHDSAQAARRHRHLSTLVGALHGLAGTAPVVALVPVTLMSSKAAAVLYLAAFGAGTIVGMAAYAGLAALAVGSVAASGRLARAAAFATAAASALVGVWWMATGIIALRT
jgi:nickel/cobalt exporter